MKLKHFFPLALALCLLITAVLAPCFAAADPFLLGDADNDNEVTIVDATAIQRLLASLIEDPDGAIAMRGDSDMDGELSIIDATVIQRWLASYAVSYPVGEMVYPSQAGTEAISEDSTSAPTQKPTHNDELPFLPAS